MSHGEDHIGRKRRSWTEGCVIPGGSSSQPCHPSGVSMINKAGALHHQWVVNRERGTCFFFLLRGACPSQAMIPEASRH